MQGLCLLASLLPASISQAGIPEPVKLPSYVMSCTVPRHKLNAIGDAVIACHTKAEV